jgi:hypothetical protein
VPIVAQVRDALRERRPYALRYRMMHADGSLREIDEVGEAVFDDRGKILYLEGALREVTAAAGPGLGQASPNARIT